MIAGAGTNDYQVAAYLREMDEANSRRTPLQHHQHHQHHHHHNPLASHHNQQQPQTASVVAAQQGTYKEVSSAIDEPAYLAIPVRCECEADPNRDLDLEQKY